MNSYGQNFAIFHNSPYTVERTVSSTYRIPFLCMLAALSATTILHLLMHACYISCNSCSALAFALFIKFK